MFELMKFAHELGLTFNSIDDGGWLVTNYLITVEGAEDQVNQYAMGVEKYLSELEQKRKRT